MANNLKYLLLFALSNVCPNKTTIFDKNIQQIILTSAFNLSLVISSQLKALFHCCVHQCFTNDHLFQMLLFTCFFMFYNVFNCFTLRGNRKHSIVPLKSSIICVPFNLK